MKVVVSAILVLLLISYTGQYGAAEVTLAWDQNPETNILGYKSYYKAGSGGPPYNGTGADQGLSPITLLIEDLADPNNPEFTLTGLDDNEVYYFVITAYNSYGESGYSNEVDTGFWSNAVDLGGGWRWLDWFGYFNIDSSPWIFHQHLGWLYTESTVITRPVFFYDRVLGWISTTSSIYPWFWWFGDRTWLYYSEGSVSPRWFYNNSTGTWQTY